MDERTPTGVGLGLRGAFLEAAAEGALDGKVAFVEVAPENYMHRGGPHPRRFAKVAERLPIITHGLMMSLGSSDPLDLDYVRTLRGFIAGLPASFPRWHSDHLCYSGLDGALMHDLLPLPHTGESVRHVAARIREVADRLEVPMAFENISYYVHMGEPELEEPDFVRAVAEEANCPILLDVNNVFVNSRNLGFDPIDWLSRVPLERVVQIHIAGHDRWDDLDMIVDTHGADVRDEVYPLLQWVIERTGPLPVLLERDHAIPPLDELLEEVQRIQAAYDEALARRAAASACAGEAAGA